MRILGVTASGFFQPAAYELIATEILTSSQPSVTFSNLGTHSSTYRHLQIRMALRSASSNANASLRFNGVTTSSYSAHGLEGAPWDRSTPNFYGVANQTNIGVCPTMPSTEHFSPAVIDIVDAFSTTKFTTIKALNGYSWNDIYRGVNFVSGAFLSTDAINSVTITGGSSLAAGSRLSIYGIRG